MARRHGAAVVWRKPALALVGVLALVAALASPLDELAHEVFVAHMVQHLLLVSVAAPAILLADPLAAALWGLPPPLRRGGGWLLAPRSPARRVFATLIWAPVAWLVHATVLWLWHVPQIYDAAVEHRVIHDAEHLALFGSALLYWWPVIAAAPRVRTPPSPPALIAYLVLGAFQASSLGLWLMTRSAPLYGAHAVTSLAWGLNPLEDQAWGGVIMWTASAVVDMGAVLAVLFRFFTSESNHRARFLDALPPVRDN